MDLLIQLYKISSPSKKEKDMIRFISGKLDAMAIPYEIDKYGNIYATKGKSISYPCIVAHTDEVHPKRKNGYEVVNFRDEIIFGYDAKRNHFEGIGADDKNGIWICLKCLEEYENMKCAFFMGEEIGCIGSNRADMGFFDDCRYVLQCDRRGNSDLITSISGLHLCSDDFINDLDLSEYGYKATSGFQTDVATLKKRGLEVSCVNISCGYYNPHNKEEYTKIADLNKCHQFVRHIIETCAGTYHHTYISSRLGFFRSYDHPYSFYFDDVDEENYGSHEKSSGVFPDESRLSSYFKGDFLVLVDILTQKLAFDSDLTVKQLMEIYKERFPELNRQDFENAYREVMG